MYMDVYTCTGFQNLPDSPARIKICQAKQTSQGFANKGNSLNIDLDVCWFAILGISSVKSATGPIHRGQGEMKKEAGHSRLVGDRKSVV